MRSFDDLIRRALAKVAKATSAVSVAGAGALDPFAAHLHHAAREGDIDKVRYWLAEGACVNSASYGKTALFVAIEHNHERVANLLIRCGADPRSFGRPLNISPLHMASLHGMAEASELLIQNGAVVNVIYDVDGMRPLHYAKSRAVAELLISEGANVNAQCTLGHTALHTAMSNFRTEIPTLMSIHLDVECLRYAVGEALLLGGADPNIVNSFGDTPLHSIWTPQPMKFKPDELELRLQECINLLISHGATIDARDRNGRTLLFKIVENDLGSHGWRWVNVGTRVRIAKLLLQRGADPSIRNSNGQSLQDVLKTQSDPEMNFLLR